MGIEKVWSRENWGESKKVDGSGVPTSSTFLLSFQFARGQNVDKAFRTRTLAMQASLGLAVVPF